MTVIDTNSNCIGSIDVLRARGVTAVGRYYRVVHPEWRLTKAEARKLSAAGIKIFTVYEDVGHNLRLTAAQGRLDGQNALEQATEIGQPKGTPIYFALEGLPNGYVASDLPAIRKYIDGVRQAINAKYQIGVYSNGLVCETLLDEGLISYTWLSASKAFAGTRDFYRTRRWNLAQTTPLDQNWNGLSVDVDEAAEDFGAFMVGATSDAPQLTSASADTELAAAHAEIKASNAPMTADAPSVKSLLAIASDAHQLLAAQHIAAKRLLLFDGETYPSDGCAITLSVLLQQAGIAIPDTFRAFDLAKRLRDRGWQVIAVGAQHPGDVGCTCASVPHHGTDHIYLVVKLVNSDEMIIADNQADAPHFRSASGRGGKSPTTFFLRAPNQVRADASERAPVIEAVSPRDDQSEFDEPPGTWQVPDTAGERGHAAEPGQAHLPGETEASLFDAPDITAVQESPAAVPFRSLVAAASVLRRPGAVGPQVLGLHQQLEARLFARKPAAAFAAAESVSPPGPQDMIIGVGIGAAHRDFESVGAAGPGAPVLNVYVAEAMGMEAVKRVLVDYYGMDGLTSDLQPVNVHYSGPVYALAHTHRERPSPCGISVGHYKITAGTQGVLARGIPGSGRERRLLMLSNNHVLANENDCNAGDPIHQPGPIDLSPTPATQVGILERWVPIDFSNGGENYVDCATAWCVPGNHGRPNVVRRDFIRPNAGLWSYFTVSGQTIQPTSGLQVGKSGRTTQLTSGSIVDLNASISVSYSGKVANFKDQITITGNRGSPFSAGGDSGSLIWSWDETRSPVGLLFAGGRDYTFANKIDHVLQALEIELYT